MRPLLRPIGIALLAGAVSAPAHALSLRDRLPAAARLVGIEGGSAFDALSDAIADTAARNLPVVAASAGYTYRYNPALEAFERTSDTLGPLFLERPDTLGRGKLNVNVSYQYVELNEIDGTGAGHLEAPDPIVIRQQGLGGVSFTANRLRYKLSLVNHIEAVSVTYGLLDDLDVNLLLPLLETTFDVTATSQQRFTAGSDRAFVPQPAPEQRATSNGSQVGVGDLLLRAKYQLPHAGSWRWAAGLQLRLPSGAKGDLQGTGTFEASPFLYVSTLLGSRVEPHANLGLDLRADDVARSQARYGLGVDVDVTRRVGVALAFLGRSQFEGSSPSGETDFLHLTSAGLAQRPLLGISFDRKDFFDLSFGTRAVLWREIMLFVNGIYALNDEGLRNDSVIPTIGVEGTF